MLTYVTVYTATMGLHLKTEKANAAQVYKFALQSKSIFQ